MKKHIIVLGVTTIIMIIGVFFINTVNAANEVISDETESTLVELKEKEMSSLEDYKDAYRI